ncbi:MAG: UDP-N-acetylmuramoyl-L-alanine--D-glutamate ligase [Myxococcales bacterium]|nr:UDP-N-acetylmuramoyl-L-alanine--D-glutamate ligase [Myxococcales bacterium]
MGGSDDSLKGRQVAVVGLGKSGLSAIELCLSHGARVRAVDDKKEAQVSQAASLRARGVRLELGGIPEDLAAGAELVVVSPGVPLSLPRLRLAASQVPVIGEVELAYRFLERSAPSVLGVTGTNGKSTTTALAGELCARGGRRVFVGGNLGRPWSSAALEKEPYDAHVVELSSFQLEGVERARFTHAAILNLTPDHLDRYESHEAYGAAKARIFMNQRESDVAVVNADDAHVMRLAELTRAKLYGFSLRNASPGRLRGLALADGEGFRLELSSTERYVLRNRALRGAHNLANAMAASLLARLWGAAPEEVQTGLDGFGGLPHRLESVRTLEGVEWVNDSKATNVDSALVALRAFRGRLWLIAGGKGKGAPYSPMVEESRGKVLGVLTVGQDAPAIEAAYRGVAPCHGCGTIDSAVRRARELARAGDVVLLSPACASYDQFRNFEHRGDTFKRLVMEL